MPVGARSRSKATSKLSVVTRYDVAADAKKRISLRGSSAKYFHVKAFSNGCYLLEPRELVPVKALSSRASRMLDTSVANFKKGIVSAPIDLTPFLEG